MRKNRNPIMLAFLIFLFVVIVVGMFSSIFHFSFPSWSKIVVATTISTYFFTLAYFEKSIVDLLEYFLLFNNEMKEKYIEFKHYIMLEKAEIDEFKEETLPTVESQIELFNNTIEEAEKHLSKTDKLYYALTVLGFLSFFIVFAFNSVNKWLYSQQELFTMIAFLLMMFTEFVLATKKDSIAKEKQTMVDAMDALIKMQKHTALLSNEIVNNEENESNG